MTSSNKPSTFPAKRKSGSKEKPLKQPHPDASTLKHVILEIIKCLHKEYFFLDTEHLFMLPINWLNHSKVRDVNVDILQIFYNAYSTPILFLLKDFNSWDLNIHGSPNYLQKFFMWMLSLMNVGPRRIIHLQCFEMV